jgi:AcrR family transcriptional regulator
MPRSATRNATMRAASHDRLLRAALALFATHGFEGTSVRMIAAKAGVAPGLLYAYFPSKDALLEACFEGSMRDVLETFAAADAEPNPQARIATLVRSSAEVIRRNLDFWRLSYGVRMQPAVLARIGTRVSAWSAQIMKVLTRYCADAGSTQPAIDAAVLFAVIDGVHQHFVLDPARYPLDAALEGVIARFAPQRSRKAGERGGTAVAARRRPAKAAVRVKKK